MKKDFEKLFLQVYGPFLQEHGFVKKKLKDQWSRYVIYLSYDKQAGLLRIIHWKMFLTGDTGLYDINIGVNAMSYFYTPFSEPEFLEVPLRISNSHNLKQDNQRQNDLAFHYFRDNPELTTLGLQVTFEIMMEYQQYLLANSISQYIEASKDVFYDGYYYLSDFAFYDAIMMNNITEAIQINDCKISRLKEDIESRQRDIMDSRHIMDSLQKVYEEGYLKSIDRYQKEILEKTQIKEQLLRGEYSFFQREVQMSRERYLKWIDEVFKPNKSRK